MRLNFDLVGLLLLLALISSSSLCSVGFEAGGIVNFSFSPVRSMEIQKKGAWIRNSLVDVRAVATLYI